MELQFDGMYAVLAGSNSPASLASRPIRYLILDEVDKYDRFAGKEGDPISLAKERQKTFTTNKKTFMTSTQDIISCLCTADLGTFAKYNLFYGWIRKGIHNAH